MTEPAADLLDAAGALAARIRGMARPAAGGAAVWPAAGGGAATLGAQLYDGTPGVALFLAAADHARGTRESRDVVARALAPLRRSLAGVAADPERAARLRIGVGGMTGVGGWVYALLRIAGWTGDDGLRGEAHALTLLLTPERVAADAELDVAGGSAGAVLALLALHAEAPHPNARGRTPLAIAAECGARLLDARVSHEGRPRAWPGGGGPPLSGFAHGASGVAYALLRLAAHTGDGALREAALEAVAFEHSLRGADGVSWMDPRFGRPVEQCAWCHGAPGIALARAAARDGALRDEARALLAHVRALPPAPVDHLCCGNAGQVDILVSAHAAFPEMGLNTDARARAREMLRRAGPGLDLTFAGALEDTGFRPDLFRGAAGAGMALLRAAAPGAIPSPLLLA